MKMKFWKIIVFNNVFIKIVVLLTIVTDDPLLTIINHEPSLTTIPSLKIK